MQDPSKWQATIPNHFTALMGAIDELDKWLKRSGADEKVRYLGKLAVEELGTNIIKYGYDDQKEHCINLRAAIERDLFRFYLEDDGHEFNPCRAPEPDPHLSLDERKPGGWGLSLVRQMSAGMTYQRQNGRNLVCVSVTRSDPSAQP